MSAIDKTGDDLDLVSPNLREGFAGLLDIISDSDFIIHNANVMNNLKYYKSKRE